MKGEIYNRLTGWMLSAVLAMGASGVSAQTYGGVQGGDTPFLQSLPTLARTAPTGEEAQLYILLMNFRTSQGLPTIAYSKALTHVAQVHVRDLEANYRKGTGCAVFSWSDQGPWSPCCYTPDHKNAQAMWDKPRELTYYTGSGFEAACSIDGATMTAQMALDCMKGNELLINGGAWSEPWYAIGVGISEHYAVLWFGNEDDSHYWSVGGVPQPPKKGSQQTQSASASHAQQAAKPEQETYNLGAHWTQEEVDAANTAKHATYMTELERNVILYINLARLYPQKFAKEEVADYHGAKGFSVHAEFDAYKASLMSDLRAMTAIDPLAPSYDMYLNAKCWADEQSRTGSRGHVRTSCEKLYRSECCDYGSHAPREIVMHLLIDAGVTSLGHRKICLDNLYKTAGVAHVTHPKTNYCTVIDMHVEK